MKPIQLKVQAFGPYLHETTIDFSRFQADGLFLITGQTGAEIGRASCRERV